MACAHTSFACRVVINRLTKTVGGAVTGYSADVTARCAECGVPFRFIGVPYGVSPGEPRLSADATELRAPIEPAYVQEVLGVPVVSGRA